MKKVLVIEDEESIRSVVIAFLEFSQFQVFSAPNGLDGVHLAKEHLPDLIICDINMPQLDGYGVLKTLRENPATAAIPFIFLTGKGELDDLRKGMDLGADDYLIKPFRREALLKAIDVRLAKQAAVESRFTAELKQVEEKLNRLLQFDVVTNLPNRFLLKDSFDHVVQGLSQGQSAVLLSLCLDRYERINASMGHTAGEELLRKVAERLVNIVGPKETVTRFHADQFVIFLSRAVSEGDLREVAQGILDRFSAEPFVLEGTGVFTTVSMGIALYPADGNNMDQVIQGAEAAMRQAKKRGGNTFLLYTPAFSASATDQLTLEASLRYALERNEFELFYQPQVNLSSGEIVGAEALVRWRHPNHGLVTPGQFIPVAEESGLIVAISEWVLRTACLQAKKWQDAGFSHFQVAVNLSGHHFSEQNIVERLVQIMKESNFYSNSLDIELTESILMKNVETAILTLHELKALGVQISLDDFGTGYSSLSYLKRFPIDVLKIDQSFVRNLPEDSKNAAITIAMIEMGHNLNLKVVAEGVETVSELSFLRRCRCDQMQGYLFSRPLPASEFEKLLFSGQRLQIPSE